MVSCKTDAPPPSNGALGPFVGEAFQAIDLDATAYTNLLTLGGGLLEVALHATWREVDDTSWVVTFKRIEAKLLGRRLVQKAFESGNTREWVHTAVEDSYRVVRARVNAGAKLGQTPWTSGRKVPGEDGEFVTFYMERA